MKRFMLASLCLIVSFAGSAQPGTRISASDLQYIKDFFEANFEKLIVKIKDKNEEATFRYEITNEAIILYKNEIQDIYGDIKLIPHWYYLPLNEIRLLNYSSNLNYYQGMNAIRIERKSGYLPHGLSKKITKVADAERQAGWIHFPFRYKNFSDLERLKNILEPPVKTPATVAKSPAPIKSTTEFTFKSTFLKELMDFASQLNETNIDKVMKAADYLPEKNEGNNQWVQYIHDKKRSIKISKDSDDSSYTHVLSMLALSFEQMDILKDFENNNIQFARKDSTSEAVNYFFAKEASPYVFLFRESNSEPTTFYIIKVTVRKKEVVQKKQVINLSEFQITPDEALAFYKYQEQKNKKYDVSEAAGLATFLNDKTYKALNWIDKKNYPFDVLGRTDFTKKSVEFIAKKQQLYIKLNIPLNGTCDYGLKEVKAIDANITKSWDKETTKAYYVTFHFNYSCAGTDYKYLTVYIEDKDLATYPMITQAMKKLAK